MYRFNRILLFALLCINGITYNFVSIPGTISGTFPAPGLDVIGLNISVNDLGHAMAVWGLDDGFIYASFFDGTSWSAASTIGSGLSPWVSLNSDINDEKAIAIWQTSLTSGDIESASFFSGSWAAPVTVEAGAIFDNSTSAAYPLSRIRVAVDSKGNGAAAWLEVDNSATPVNYYVKTAYAISTNTSNTTGWVVNSTINTPTTEPVFMDPTAQITYLFDNGSENPIAFVSWLQQSSGGYIARYSSQNDFVPSIIKRSFPVSLNNFLISAGTASCANINRTGSAAIVDVVNQNRFVAEVKLINEAEQQCSNFVNNPTLLYNAWTTVSNATPTPKIHRALSTYDQRMSNLGYWIDLTTSVGVCSSPAADSITVDFNKTLPRFNPMICSFDDNAATMFWNSQTGSSGDIGIIQYDGTKWDQNNIQFIAANLKANASKPSLDVPFYVSCSPTAVSGQYFVGVIWWDDSASEIKTFVANGTATPGEPSPVTNVQAACSGVNQITLNWQLSPDSDIASQSIFRDNGDGIFTEVAESPVSNTTTTLINLNTSLDITYSYYIQATNSIGIKSKSLIIKIKCTSSAPLAPQAVNAQCGNKNGVLATNISWTHSKPSSLQKYQLYRSSFAEAILIADDIAPNTFSYQDATIEAGSIYNYYMVAVSTNTKESQPSNIATVGPCSLTSPPAPTELNAVCAAGPTATLSWKPAPSDAAITLQRIFRDGYPIDDVGATVTAYTDPFVLTLDQEYVYKVVSIRGTPEEVSNDAKTTITCPSLSAPLAPAVVHASCALDNSNTIDLTWNATSSNFDFYRIYRSGSTSSIAKVPRGTVSYKDTQIDFGIEYYYSVSTENNSVESNKVTSNTLTCHGTAPTQITDLSAACATGPQITLTWTPPTNDVTRQEIYRNGNLIAASLSAIANEYLDTDVAFSTPYTYAIRAYNNDGQSSISNIIGIECFLTTPDNVTEIEVDCDLTADNRRGIRLSWQPSTTVGVMSQRIYRNNKLLVELAPTVTTYLDESVTEDVIYSYNITAVGAGGEEAKSKTLPSINTSVDEVINLKGICTFNQFASEGEYYKTLSWALPTITKGKQEIVPTISVNIFRDGTLIATIPGTQLQYEDHDRPVGVAETYTLTRSILCGKTGSLVQGRPASITVTC